MFKELKIVLIYAHFFCDDTIAIYTLRLQEFFVELLTSHYFI